MADEAPETPRNGPVSAPRFHTFEDGHSSHIGRFPIPFPFDLIFGLVMLPVLFLAAGVSIPLGWIHNHRMRKQESLFTIRMKSAARLLSWEEANRQAATNGT